MNHESVPYFQRFTVANMVLAGVLAFARPVIDATTEPPTTIEIERQAAADERPIMIQAVSVHQESIIDQVTRELEYARQSVLESAATTKTTGTAAADRPADADNSDSLPGRESVGRQADATEAGPDAESL